MLIACGNNIYPYCVDTAVTKDIGKLGNVFFQLIKRPCKQMTQIVRKHIVRIDVSLFAQGFQLSPYVCTVDRLA
jgi:hypothetical protein